MMSWWVWSTVGCLTDCSVPNTALDHGIGDRVHANAARAVDHAVTNDGLGEERQWWRSFVSQDCDSSRHDDEDFDR